MLHSIIKEIKVVFARYGILNSLVTHNGPQFLSAKFAAFDHITSSPTCAQSNGKVENAVKTVKRLFKKCKESVQYPYGKGGNKSGTAPNGLMEQESPTHGRHPSPTPIQYGR